MSNITTYKNAKAGRMILESYDALLKLWGADIKELDISGRYGTTHVIETGNQNMPPLVSRVARSLGKHKGKDREGDAPDNAQGNILWIKNHADMIDQHGDGRNDLECVAAQTAYPLHGVPPLPTDALYCSISYEEKQ